MLFTVEMTITAHILNAGAGMLAIHFHRLRPSVQAVIATAIQSKQTQT